MPQGRAAFALLSPRTADDPDPDDAHPRLRPRRTAVSGPSFTAGDGAGFAVVLDTLMGFNRVWAVRAAALIVICTATTRVDSHGVVQPMRLSAFDAGAAWMSLALQGHEMGLVVHGMEGFDHVALAGLLKVPAGIDVLAVAIGLPGEIGDLPADKQPGERPNQRRATADSVVFDTF